MASFWVLQARATIGMGVAVRILHFETTRSPRFDELFGLLP